MSFIDTEFDEDEGGLRAEDTLDWPVWIAIDPYEKLLILKTCRVADIFANWREAASWVNAANARMALVQFHIADARIWGYHWISYIDGLNIRQLIKTLRRFSTGFKEGVLIEPDYA